MPEFIAQRIHHGKKVGNPLVFTVDPVPKESITETAHREAHDGIDIMKGMWVDVRLAPKKSN